MKMTKYRFDWDKYKRQFTNHKYDQRENLLYYEALDGEVKWWMEYDDQDRVIRATCNLEDEPDIYWEYDAQGRPWKIAQGLSVREFEYDSKGNRRSKIYFTDPMLNLAFGYPELSKWYKI